MWWVGRQVGVGFRGFRLWSANSNHDNTVEERPSRSIVSFIQLCVVRGFFLFFPCVCRVVVACQKIFARSVSHCALDCGTVGSGTTPHTLSNENTTPYQPQYTYKHGIRAGRQQGGQDTQGRRMVGVRACGVPGVVS